MSFKGFIEFALELSLIKILKVLKKYPYCATLKTYFINNFEKIVSFLSLIFQLKEYEIVLHEEKISANFLITLHIK